MCADLGYQYTSFPNLFLNITNQNDASLTIQTFQPLVGTECSADLKPFLCSMFAPKCIPGESSPELPSKDKCQSARSGCESIMMNFGFTWPEPLHCETLPGSLEIGEPPIPTDPGELRVINIVPLKT